MEDLTIRHGEERLDLVPSDAFDGKGARLAVLEPVDPHDVGPLEDVPELFLPLGEWKSPPAAPADVPGARS